MKPGGLLSALILAAGLTLLPVASWAGSFRAAFTPDGGLRVTASGKLAAPVAAGSLVILSAAPRTEGFGSTGFSAPTYLIVDAHPLDAQVFLDAIEIVAPGFRPYIAQFAVAPGSFPARFRVALAPE